jgi:2-hydroxychromene-2-carboxylate isomerase
VASSGACYDLSERIDFFYDPRCPWAWRTSKWVRELERMGIVSVEWRFFSLGVVNDGSEDAMDDVEDAGAASLRVLALVKRTLGNQKTGDLYEAMGERSHEVPRRLTNRIVREAIGAQGLQADLVEAAFAEDQTKKDVLQDHRAAVDGVGAFGVPTIVLESGKGIFGPVIDGDGGADAGELWTHVRWLIENGGFYELKRERD